MTYETVSLPIGLKSIKKFNETFQETLNNYVKLGFKLHSYHFARDSFVTIVFEKED